MNAQTFLLIPVIQIKKRLCGEDRGISYNPILLLQFSSAHKEKHFVKLKQNDVAHGAHCG
jgi:hypothetical protein